MHLRRNAFLSILVVRFPLSLSLSLSQGFSREHQSAFRKANLPVEQRAADLVRRLNLDDKVDQLVERRQRAMSTVSDSYDHE